MQSLLEIRDLNLSKSSLETLFSLIKSFSLEIFSTYERIISEFQVVLNLSHEETLKKLDKALKRNQQES